MNEIAEQLGTTSLRTLLAALGDAMARHRAVIQGIQWLVVLFYFSLLIYPAFLPLPTEYVHFYENLILFAQFIFWGIWWPFVMLSMMLLGRVWCGVFCPEGALTEWASRRGLGRAIPRWMRWSGWPFVAFAMTTIYGQLVSVYEYPKAALLVLGGSTVAAMIVGFIYGRGKRVWCRHLCPANGVFAILSRLAPIHLHVDRDAWRAAPHRIAAVDCAPLINIRKMTGNSACHMCGRCSGHRDAVTLGLRSPNQELLTLPAHEVTRWEVATLVFGVLGIAIGAFQWSASPWFIALKQLLAAWLINQNAFVLLQDNAPWWLLTHYPEVNDVFSWLDGLCILAYIGATTLVLGGAILAMLWLAQWLLGAQGAMWRLAYGLTPLAGVSVFLGLSGLTVSMLTAEHLNMNWVPGARIVLLALGVSWSGWLVWRMIESLATPFWNRLMATLLVMVGTIPVVASWLFMYFLW
ncbi:MAG: 4Fe-4S binding protein [Pseudomonadales bacterium]|nr:4Fe-4S binding protein [Gammaproteobacteria bacterium]MBP6051009.1 4Fe-4S binding protein [Pseudomonadales bacterium]MBP6228715.1 4Fe-4S binding protein [Pseudomonadales bacterium]